MKLFKEKKYWLFLLLVPIVWVCMIFVRNMIGVSVILIYMSTAIFLGVRFVLKAKLSVIVKVLLTPLAAFVSFYLALILVLPSWFGSVMYQDTHPKKGEDVPEYKLRWGSVRNATYIFGYTNKAMDFDVLEEEFKELATHFSQPLNEITERSVAIKRIKHDTTSITESGTDYIYVSNGLYSTYSQGNGGGYKLVFDREKQRGYYRASAR